MWHGNAKDANDNTDNIDTNTSTAAEKDNYDTNAHSKWLTTA